MTGISFVSHYRSMPRSIGGSTAPVSDLPGQPIIDRARRISGFRCTVEKCRFSGPQLDILKFREPPLWASCHRGWHRCTRSAAAYSLSAEGVEWIKFKTIETGALALRPRRSGRCVLKELDDFSVRPLTEGQPHGSRFRDALDDDILRFGRDHHPRRPGALDGGVAVIGP